MSAASFFNLDDATNCPIIDCKLYESDCTNNLNANGQIVIGDKDPWNVIVK
jgi:hypothetical protein